MEHKKYKPAIFLILILVIIMITHSKTARETETTPPPNFSKLEEPKKGEPLRIAHPYHVSLSPSTNGTWRNLDDETLLWRFEIMAPNATSLNLGFTNYFMPDGGELFIYTADMKTIIGPFTQKDNEEHRQLWTPILPSHHIIIELTLPQKQQPLLQLELTRINAGFR